MSGALGAGEDDPAVEFAGPCGQLRFLCQFKVNVQLWCQSAWIAKRRRMWGRGGGEGAGGGGERAAQTCQEGYN